MKVDCSIDRPDENGCNHLTTALAQLLGRHPGAPHEFAPKIEEEEEEEEDLLIN